MIKTTLRFLSARTTALLTTILLLAAPSAQAQDMPDNAIAYPVTFIGLQGGAQTTFTNYNNWKLITPTASISAGVLFTPVFGARVHFNGLWNKSGIYNNEVDDTYKYNYLTSDIDVLINLVNLFSKKKYHPVNLYLIGGAGLNYAWDNEDKPALSAYISAPDWRNRLSHNFRVGTMLDVSVARNWSVNLEVSGNCLSDRYNSKHSGHGDWQLTAQVGLAYKFGMRHKVKSSRDISAIATPTITPHKTETITDAPEVAIEKPAKPAPAPVAPQKTKTEVFFKIASSVILPTEQPKLAEVAQWLKEHPKAKVVITGYADAGTGTKAINARYAKQRAEAVTKELIKKYRVDAKRITTDSKGSEVQPFKENDQNRVAIILAEE